MCALLQKRGFYLGNPSWEEFTRAMGIDGDSAAKLRAQFTSFLFISPRSVIATDWRRCSVRLLNHLTQARATSLQHLEGGPWTFLGIARYNSWEDFATSEKNSVAQTTKKDSGWVRLREHVAFHNDTIADRIAP